SKCIVGTQGAATTEMKANFLFCISILLCTIASAANAPVPLPPVPTPRQIQWHDDNLALFLRIGINTFTNHERGDGKEDPAAFNPRQLDVQQWIRVAKSAGAQRLILPAKDREGFCLWPTTT